MTDELENVDQGVVPEAEPQGEPASDMLDKNTVSKIVERERLKAFAKGKQEALMELQQQQAPQESAPMQQAQAPQQLGGMQQMSPADIERMIAEKAPQMLQQHIQEMKNEHMASSFVSKMQAAEAKYPGLEAKLNGIDYTDPAMMKIVEFASNLENTGEVMKEILDHPGKMGNLLNLSRQPQYLQQAMMELSNSIKTNQDALAQEKQAQDPMSQLKPSTSAGMDNSAMSVADFQKMFKR